MRVSKLVAALTMIELFSFPAFAQQVFSEVDVPAVKAKIAILERDCGATRRCEITCGDNQFLISGGCYLTSGNSALQNSHITKDPSGRLQQTCIYQSNADIRAQAYCLVPR
jgi:hypothetical protein